ncbi:thiol:disulfide interchange protein DsbE [Rhabdaerophilaceae bacterium]
MFFGVSALGATAAFSVATAWAWKSGRLKLGSIDLPSAILPPIAGLQELGSPVPGVNTTSRSDKPLILNFWASWCPYCRSEHPILMQLSRDSRVKLIGVVMDDTHDAVAQYLTDHGNPFSEVSIDRSRLIVRAMRQRGIPSTLLVPAGETRVVAKFIGPLTPIVVAEQFLPHFSGQTALG